MRNIDAQKIVQSFGGPKQLAYRVSKAQPEEPLQIKTVEMWVYRKSIPSRWLLVLAEMAQKQGRRFDLTQYILGGRQLTKADAEDEADESFLD